MRHRLRLLALAAAISFPALASASSLQTGCAADYFTGVTPDVVNPNLLSKLRELCFAQFGVFHSGVTATPLWSAEHLTADMMREAASVEREDVFHPEPRLPADERAELSNYRGGGYDRGHMSPAADMVSREDQNESFSLANMVPQDATLNRGAWADLEGTTRGFAKSYGDVYVVTGPVFSGDKLQRVGGRVFVPTFIYKAVYIPKAGQGSAWWADNATGVVSVISLSELKARSGIDAFPTLPQNVKDLQVNLPLPHTTAGTHHQVGSEDAAANAGAQPERVERHEKKEQGYWLTDLLWTIVRELVRFVVHAILRG